MSMEFCKAVYAMNEKIIIIHCYHSNFTTSILAVAPIDIITIINFK